MGPKLAYHSKEMNRIDAKLGLLRKLCRLLEKERGHIGSLSMHVVRVLQELDRRKVTIPANNNREELFKTALDLIKTLKGEAGEILKRQKEERKVRWIDEYPMLWKKKPKAIYRFVKGEKAEWWSGPMINGDGKQCATVAEVDVEMRKFWVDNILRKSDLEEEGSRWWRYTESEFGPHFPESRAWHFTGWDASKVTKVLNAMNESAAPGHRRIPLAVWKCMPEVWFEWVAILLNKVEDTGECTEDCSLAYVTVIPKGETGDKPSDYRPITVLDVVYRLWAKGVVEDWKGTLRDTLLSPTAMGFRSGHGTTHLSQFIQDAMRYQNRQRKHLWLVSFDIAKCYDTIPWWAIFETMRKAGIPERIVGSFLGMYRQMKRWFKYGGCEGEKWEATNGLAQGCPASPDLLNLLYETFHRWAASQGLGVNFEFEDESVKVPAASYADDLTLMAGSWAELIVIIDGFLRWCKLLGLVVNVKKTQLWTNDKTAKQVEIEGECVTIQETFKVVGVVLGLNETATTLVHIKDRLERATMALKRLSSLGLPSAMANDIFSLSIMPMVSYGCEIRQLRPSHVDKLAKLSRKTIT